MVDTRRYEVLIGSDGVAFIRYQGRTYQEFLCNPDEAYILIAHTECEEEYEGDGA